MLRVILDDVDGMELACLVADVDFLFINSGLQRNGLLFEELIVGNHTCIVKQVAEENDRE